MDVHKEAIVIAVQNTRGHRVMESIVETKASSILQFIHGLQGELHVTWEEGTWAAWLYDLLQPHVHQILVCNPRRNAIFDRWAFRVIEPFRQVPHSRSAYPARGAVFM